jgi:uncharacterized membrane protein
VNKTVCFIAFSFALVLSHYAIAEIFLFVIFFASLLLKVSKYSSKNITISRIVLFFVIMFIWYIYTSNSAAFNSIISMGKYVFDQLGDFFNLESRGEVILKGLGIAGFPTVWNAISRLFAYITEALIVVGFIGLVTKQSKIRLKGDYYILTSIAMLFLAVLLIVPGLANTLNMTRFYHILLFFLAPLCVLGAEMIVRLLFKRVKEVEVSLILIFVLIPYFLFQTGFIYEFTATQSYSLSLAKYRMNTVFLHLQLGYFDESEVFGALWMSKNVDTKNSTTFADVARSVLMDYGMIPSDNIKVLTNTTILSNNATVYLNQANLINGICIGGKYSWNITDISDIWSFTNKIYSSGKCEIYKETADS